MKLPRKLAILPGLRWRGNITVIQRDDDRWLVDFDAFDPRGGNEGWISDCATLSTEQIYQWTGVDLEET